MEHDEEASQQPLKRSGKLHNVLPLWGNESTMNLNPLILTNIQSSSYFKVSLFKLKTYHEVVDEIYYQVKHLEPWERGSRKTAGQTGMCGGVRGVGAGGIVSTAFCLLYKLYTLRLTRKQVNGLLSHTDSPYIRSLGFMYIRFTQPPSDLYDWYEDYLQDEEEVDVKAGGGQIMTIGQMLRQWLVKLDWFAILFPRIPVPIQKSIEKKLEEYSKKHNLDNRLTFAEKEMNRRRGEEERSYNSEKSGSNSRAREHCDRDRDYYNGGGSSTLRGRPKSPECRESTSYERGRSRSKERSSRDSHSHGRSEREKNVKTRHDKYREYYDDRDYYRESDESGSSKYRTDRKYR